MLEQKDNHSKRLVLHAAISQVWQQLILPKIRFPLEKAASYYGYNMFVLLGGSAPVNELISKTERTGDLDFYIFLSHRTTGVRLTQGEVKSFMRSVRLLGVKKVEFPGFFRYASEQAIGGYGVDISFYTREMKPVFTIDALYSSTNKFVTFHQEAFNHVQARELHLFDAGDFESLEQASRMAFLCKRMVYLLAQGFTLPEMTRATLQNYFLMKTCLF